MPELPEVETIRRILADRIIGKQVKGVQLCLRKALRNTSPEELARGLTGAVFTGVKRRGKFLILELKAAKLVFHLRMTGQLLVVKAGSPPPKHLTLKLALSGDEELWLVDQRKFATIDWLPRGGDYPRGLGVEPLSREFTGQRLVEICQGRRAPIKALLLNQQHIAGLGNIYADESLFRAKVRPDRMAGSLSAKEVRRLHRAIRAVLRESLIAGGTSVRNYVNAEGKQGAYQNELKVYGRGGEPCVVCQTPLERIKIGGRSSCFCPRCQS